ncbi:MAG: hypothetical protein AB7U38_04230 [Hyphomicrobiales bacterium]
MKKALLFAAAMAVLPAAGMAGAGDHMDGSELRQAVIGKTIFLRTEWGIELPITYSANGTMRAQLKSALASVAGGEGASDRGKWWINGNDLCQKWDSWLDGKSYCYKLKRDGNTVSWFRNDGRSGKVRLGG